MKAGAIGGLIGAGSNMKMTDVPMRAYRDAERKGDRASMQRAMACTEYLTDKANKCKEQAEEELIKDMKEQREQHQKKLKDAAAQWKKDAQKQKQKKE